MNSEMAYAQIPAVAALNKVEGFDPLKFLRSAQNGNTVLDLKFKKLWFRLAHPTGRIKIDALKITDQMAIIEAKVYLAKEDAEPVSSCIAAGYFQGTGQLYITSAQYEAANSALADAGFGIQFCDQSGEVQQALPPAQVKSTPAAAQAPTPAQAQGKPAPAATQAQTPAQGQSKPALTVAPPVETPKQQAAPATPPVKQPEAATQAEKPPVQQAPAPQVQPDAASKMPEAVEAQKADAATMAPAAGSSATPKQAETTLAESVPPVPQNDAETAEISPAAETSPGAGYTADMPVDEIVARMTLDEARAIVVGVGSRKGMTLQAVSESFPASLKWYVNAYDGDDHILKAGAKLMLGQLQKAG